MLRGRQSLPLPGLPALGLLLAPALLSACSTVGIGRHVNPDTVDLTVLLAPPPAAGSAAAQADLDAVLAAQATRTPAEEKAAREDASVSVFRFADVLGPGFNAERLPKTEAVFKAAGKVSTRIGFRAKQYWDRPRPFHASKEVKPAIRLAWGGSYPSGHSMYGCLSAVLLGTIVPERRTELLARGDEYAQNRVVGGVHYPTDIAAGCTAGKIVAAVLLQDPEFQAGLAVARDETRAALGLPADPGPAN